MATAVSVRKTLLNKIQSELGVKVRTLIVRTEEVHNRHFRGWFHYCTVKIYGASNEISSFTLEEEYLPFDGKSHFFAELSSDQVWGKVFLENNPELDRYTVRFREEACPLPEEVEPIIHEVPDENIEGDIFVYYYYADEPPTGWQYGEEVPYLLLYNSKWEVHFPLKSGSRELFEA